MDICMKKRYLLGIYLLNLFYLSYGHLVNPLTLFTNNNVDIVPWYLALHYTQQEIPYEWLINYADQIYTAINKPNNIIPEIVADLLTKVATMENIGPVIINKHNTIVAGTELVAAGILLQKQVDCTIIDSNDVPLSFDFLKKQKLDTVVLDWLVLEFMRLSKNCYNFILWPKGRKHAPHIKNRLNSIGQVIYEKIFELQNYGHYLFVSQIAGKEPQLNTFLNIYFRSKFNPTNITLLVLQTHKSATEVREFKQKLRNEINYHAGIHGDDNNRQAVSTCRMILLKTTADFINYVQFIPPHFYNDLIKEFQTKNGLTLDSFENYCGINFNKLNSDKKIKYITSKQESRADPQCLNSSYSNEQKNAILYDPVKHFYYQQMKFEYPKTKQLILDDTIIAIPFDNHETILRTMFEILDRQENNV
jgi:hypothetical protein